MTTDAFPRTDEPRAVAPGWSVLPSWAPVPGLGLLAVNAFLRKGREPMLVDTGIGAMGDGFLAALEREIDPAELRWIWVSHTDADHVGNLPRVLKRAPNAKVVTNGLGAAKMQLLGLDTTRLHLMEPGAVLELGDTRLIPVRPPYYDAPETMGFFDPTTRVLFAADSFGALLDAPADDAAAIDADALRDGLVGWSSVDAPWLGSIDQSALGRTLSAIERLDPDVLLTGHLPVARGNIGRLTRILRDSYGRGTMDGADAVSFDALLARLEGEPVH